jgi:hypothetical protein
MTVNAFLERTTAIRQFTDEELKRTFDSLKQEYNNDFALMLFALHVEMEGRCAQLETRVAKLENKKR